MNEEIKKQLLAIVRLFIVCLCACLYAFGGVHWLWMRRFIAPTVCAVGCFAFSRDWRYFVQMPFMMGSLSLGYGADTLWIKIAKRGLFGLANGISGSITDLWNKRVLISALWTTILVLAYVGVGAFSPLPDARIEELFLGFLIFFKPLMSVRPNT